MMDAILLSQSHAAFRFVVEVGGERMAAFTECSLPVIEWDMQEVKEGGLNGFMHQLPSRRKSATLTLKNGVGKTGLFAWYLMAMGEVYERRPVTITLLDSKHKPVMVWHIKDALPKRWSGPQLQASSTAVAIQELQLTCGEITVA